MLSRLTYLSSFVLAAGLLLSGAAHAADPGLVGWWKLDDGTGTNIADSSGGGHNGVFAEGTPLWVEGKYGKALQFDGKNKVEIPDHADFHMQDAITIALWAKPEATQPEYAKLFIKQRSNEYPYGLQYTGNAQSIRATVNASIRYDSANTPNFPGEWGHLCMTYEGSALVLYKNGKEVTRMAATGKIQQNDLSLSIGGRLDSTQNFIGIIDDVRLYNKALTPPDIMKLMERPPLGPASRPSPNVGAQDVPRDVVLSWTPGELAGAVNGHIVYFSKNLRDVTDGVGGVTQSVTTYVPAQRLDFETTYYWRVDEVNIAPSSTFKGDIWSFTTEPVGYPIGGAKIIATASSVGDATFGPENTINGSGLDANDLHSTAPTDMWLSSNEPSGAWIQYEFDKLYKLHQMWVWNANQTVEGLFGIGMKDATVEYSANGSDWTALALAFPFTRAPGTPGYAHDTTVDFGGASAKYVKLSARTNWAGMLPQYGLSEVRFFYIPVAAREPSPVQGAAAVSADGTLNWRAGREAAAHKVYLSTDRQAVVAGAIPAASVSSPSYSAPLDLASTYYWRIDEVNDAQTPATWQGDVWDFVTETSLVVDGFEDYNDYPPNEIYTTWADGFSDPANGSQVGNLTPPLVETKIVHGGKQSMPFFYSNTAGATYSEGKRIFATPQDWTQHAVRTLGLYFFGTTGNTGQLYVKINETKIPYDGPAANLARAGWQPWNIDLTAASGLNLQNVRSLAIGIDGNGANGTFCFDDIRLYPFERQFITPITPNDVALIGHWKFDGNVQDSSAQGNHGTSGGNPVFVAGQAGQAVELDGSDYVVIDSVANDITTTTFTISAWIKTSQASAGNVVASNDSASGHVFILGVDQGFVLVEANTSNRYPPLVNDNQWHFIAYVRDRDIAYVYVDGYLVGKEIPSGDPTTQVRWSIGQEWDSANSSTPSDFYTGLVDDVRIYNYALSHAETAWLAGRTQAFEKPF